MWKEPKIITTKLACVYKIKCSIMEVILALNYGYTVIFSKEG